MYLVLERAFWQFHICIPMTMHASSKMESLLGEPLACYLLANVLGFITKICPHLREALNETRNLAFCEPLSTYQPIKLPPPPVAQQPNGKSGSLQLSHAGVRYPEAAAPGSPARRAL